MLILRQATAVIVHIGPLVDATDGFTAETAVAFAASELDLYKAQATAAVDISGRTVAHIAGGVYQLSLLASDTDTLGPIAIIARDAAHRPFRLNAAVVNPNWWDAMFAGDALWVDAREVDGSLDAAANLRRGALATVPLTVQAGSSSARIATNLTEGTNDHYNGRTVVFITGALAGQATTVLDYNGATKELTVASMTEAPSNGDLAVIV
jgi:hypothetical protein